MKFQPYSQIMIALVCFLLGLFAGRFQLTISWNSNDSATVPRPTTLSRSKSPLSQVPEPKSLPKFPTEKTQKCQLPITTLKPSIIKTKQGNFRVSNCTTRPVRVALLAKSSAQSYQKSAHWDFAPREGSERGLILSLPEEKLTLKPGDILVVFAQDGSRLYWGPYVVGETNSPVWSQETNEWQLVLQP
ncbi:MAG: hypothetical protein QNJ68_18180 [Microcoleaceae cyanobacterium MO_207.B10]|nr:hypothetical protein [Microcoleaceae cyanobacterium MO_207.B10]